MIYEKLPNPMFIDNEFMLRVDDAETKTIDPEGIEPLENGEYYVRKGWFIDKDGKVITLSSSDGETLEFSSDPVGIITETHNITNHEKRCGYKKACSILRRGVIQAEFLPYPEDVEYNPSFKVQIEEKLPHIICYGADYAIQRKKTRTLAAISENTKNVKYTVNYTDIGTNMVETIIVGEKGDVKANGANYKVTVKDDVHTVEITELKTGGYTLEARVVEDGTKTVLDSKEITIA